MKKHSFKKVLALLLALIMILSTVPMVVSAGDGATDGTTGETPATPAKDIVYKPLDVDDLTTENPHVKDGAVDFSSWFTEVKTADKELTLDSKDDLIIFMLFGQQASTSVGSLHWNGYTVKLTANVTLNEGEATETGFDPAESQKIAEGDNAGKYIVHTWLPYLSGYTKTDGWSGLRGTFNGGAKTITGMVIDGSESTTPVGFFSTLGNSGKVQSLYFKNAYVEGGSNVGIIAGRITMSGNNGTVNDSVLYCKAGGVVSGTSNVGGMVGCVLGKSSGADKSEHDRCILDVQTPEIYEGTIIINSGDNTGAVIGNVDGYAYVKQVRHPVVGACTIKGAQNVGGLIGNYPSTTTKGGLKLSGGDIKCTIEGTANIGGMVGNTVTPVTITTNTISGKLVTPTLDVDIKCTATDKDIKDHNDVCLGGLIGLTTNAVEATHVSVTGQIHSDLGCHIGGFVAKGGAEDIKITKSSIDCNFNDGTSNTRYVGGAVGSTTGNLTLDEITADINLRATTGIGGLFGRPSADAEGKNVTITNSVVSGKVASSGKYINNIAIGGFIGATGTHTVTISDSVCYATVNTNASREEVLRSTAGFIGCAEANTTLNNCQFLSKVTFRTIENFEDPWNSAFVNAVGLTSGNYPSADTETTTAYKISLVDCYYVEGSAQRAIGVTPDCTNFTISIDYNGDDKAAVEYNVATIAAMTDENEVAFDALKCGDHISDGIKSLEINTTHSAKYADIAFVQMGTNNNARFVTSIANSNEIKGIDYEVTTVKSLANEIAALEHPVSHAYTSIKNNYGLETLTAGEGILEGAEYISTMILCGVNTDKDADGVNNAATVLVRVRVTLKTGEIVYSEYMAATFCGSEILSVAKVG